MDLWTELLALVSQVVTPIWNNQQDGIFNYPFWFKEPARVFPEIAPVVDTYARIKPMEARVRELYMAMGVDLYTSFIEIRENPRPGIVDALAKHPDVKLVSDSQYGGATTETAEKASENLLAFERIRLELLQRLLRRRWQPVGLHLLDRGPGRPGDHRPSHRDPAAHHICHPAPDHRPDAAATARADRNTRRPRHRPIVTHPCGFSRTCLRTARCGCHCGAHAGAPVWRRCQACSALITSNKIKEITNITTATAVAPA